MRLTPRDVISEVYALGTAQHAPEAVSVKVVTPSEETARLVAPMLARRLYPDRAFGEVLNLDWLGDGFACDVAVRGDQHKHRRS